MGLSQEMIRSRDIVLMEEKTIVDWETQSKSPTTKSSRVDARPNRVEVDSIEIESESVGRMNSQQNQGESSERGTEIDSIEEVKEEPTMLNGGQRYPLRERKALEDFWMKSVYP